MPDSQSLTSRSKAKVYLQLNQSDVTYNEFIDDLIDGVSAGIEEYTARKFVSRSYTEYYDGDGTRVLLLRQFPIVSITSIHDDPDRNYNSDTLIDADDYVSDDDIGKVTLVDIDAFTKGIHAIKVIYTAGYASVPKNIQLAAHVWIADIFNRAVMGADGEESESIGQHSVTFNADEMPKRARSLLRPFKKFST